MHVLEQAGRFGGMLARLLLPRKRVPSPVNRVNKRVDPGWSGWDPEEDELDDEAGDVEDDPDDDVEDELEAEQEQEDDDAGDD